MLWSHADSDGCMCLLEVVADDTPAVQAVLKADTRRLKLLEEEKRLQARLDRGEDNVSEELEKVCILAFLKSFLGLRDSYLSRFYYYVSQKEVNLVGLYRGLSNRNR